MCPPTISRMKIKRIEQTASRAGRVRIVFDDDSRRMVYPSVVADLGLYSGMELSQADLERLQEAAGEASAKNRAVRIAAASGVTKKDLRRRLVAKGERPEDADSAVQWLEDLSLLDDSETAKQIVRRGVRKGYGRARIRQMLYEKQVPREYWDEALAEIPDMSDAVDAFLAARLGGRTADEKTVQKTVDALLRRGYSYAEIKEGLRRYESGTEEFLEDNG